MKSYNLTFNVLEKEILLQFEQEVSLPKKCSSIIYREIVEQKISEWLKSNKMNGREISILDIKLNDGAKLLFSQADRKDTSTIEIFQIEE